MAAPRLRVVSRKGAAPAINPEMERAALGGLLIDSAYLPEVATFLRPTDFYEPKHSTLYAALLALLKKHGAPPDIVQLDEYLRKTGQLADVGGSTYTHDLINSCGTSLRTIQYCKEIFTIALERRKRLIGESLADNGMAFDAALQALTELQERGEILGNAAWQQEETIAGVIAADVEKVPIAWMWRGYFAYGKLALIDGDPGQGKGLLTQELTARVSRGRPMPGEAPRDAHEPAGVVLLTPEDDPSDTIRPRLEAAGADLSRVRILTTTTSDDGVNERFISIPRDVPLLEAAIRHDNARLLVIDPITACLDPGVKTHVDSEVRAALMPLQDMARRTGCTVIIVRHLNKGSGDNALYRGGGSIAFAGLCRTTFLVATHPDGENARVFAPVKSNISGESASLSFSIVTDDADAWPRITWDAEPCDLKANELLGVRQSEQAREIIRILKDAGKPLKPTEIASELGISDRDQAGQAAIRKRLSRMAKARRIYSPTYGTYSIYTYAGNTDAAQ